jgi:hypothetical protein
VFDQNQLRLDAMSQTAQNAFGQIAPGAFNPSPFIQQAQAAAGQTLGGAYLNFNPATATFNRLQGAQNPATAYMTDLAGGSTSPGNYSSIGGANPATAMFQGLAGGGNNSAMPGLRDMAYSTGSNGTGDNVISAIANGTNGNNPAAGYDSDIMAGKYLNQNPGQAMYMDTIAGKYLNSNPWIDQIAKQGEDAALKAANQRFAASGIGAGLSSAYTDVATRNVADAGNSLRYQNYEAERGRQFQAGQQADAAFANERGNMEGASGRTSANYNAAQDRALSAATALSAGSRADTAQRQTSLGQLFDVDQQQYANQASTAGSLGSLYNQQQALQLQGQQAMDASFQADRAARLAGATGLGSMYSQDAQTQLAGTNGAGGAYDAERQRMMTARASHLACVKLNMPASTRRSTC